MVVLNWNGWRDTERCLASLQESDYENLQVIVVDNGSSDNSVDKIRTNFPDLCIIASEANLGFGGGNNLGITKALSEGSEYVWLLNNDTLVYPNTLTELVRLAARSPRAGAIGSVLLHMNDPKKVQAWGGGWVNLLTGATGHFVTDVVQDKIDYLTAASILLRVSALEAVGLFDEDFFMYWEDADLSFRLRNAGWILLVAKNALVLHKETGSSVRGSAQLDYYYHRSANTFMRKHSPVPLFPQFLSTGWRVMRRLARAEWDRVAAIWRATWS